MTGTTYVNRPLISAEVTEDYNGGNVWTPRLRSFHADIANIWLFEDDLTDHKGSAHFTGVGLDASNFVAP